jgi:hypothetical protein
MKRKGLPLSLSLAGACLDHGPRFAREPRPQASGTSTDCPALTIFSGWPSNCNHQFALDDLPHHRTRVRVAARLEPGCNSTTAVIIS